MEANENIHLAPIPNSILTKSEPSAVRLEGVFCKGYGHLPKMVMFDPDLTIEAKTIYAFFCSYAGAGEDVDMPPVAVIQDILGIGKVAYAKHFKRLLSNGYIRAEQTKGKNEANSSYFSKNAYTIVKFPEKFQSYRPDGQYKKEYANINARRDLIGAGYGLIPKLPLLCMEIPIAVKGLYAYLICFATHEEPVVWPSYDMIQRHLNISEGSVKKYLSILAGTPFVRKLQQERNCGQFGSAKYEIQFSLTEGINLEPQYKNDATEPQYKNDATEPQYKNDTAEPQYKNDATEPQYKNDATEPQYKNDTTEPQYKNDTTEPQYKNDTTEPQYKIPPSEEPPSEEPPSENDTLIYNTSKYNTTFNNTIIEKTINLSGEPNILEPPSSVKQIDQMDRITQPVFEEEDWGTTIAEDGNIPKEVLFDERRRSSAVNYICEWSIRSKPTYYLTKFDTDPNLRRKIYITFVNALKDLLNPDNAGNRVSYYRVWESIPMVLNIAEDPFGDMQATLSDFIDACTETYYKTIKKKAVEFPLAYMKSLIWNALLDGGLTDESTYMHELVEDLW